MASDSSDSDSLKELTKYSRIKFKEKEKEDYSNYSPQDFVGKTYQSDEEVKLFIENLQNKTKENYYQRDVCVKDDITNDERS